MGISVIYIREGHTYNSNPPTSGPGLPIPGARRGPGPPNRSLPFATVPFWREGAARPKQSLLSQTAGPLARKARQNAGVHSRFRAVECSDFRKPHGAGGGYYWLSRFLSSKMLCRSPLSNSGSRNISPARRLPLPGPDYPRPPPQRLSNPRNVVLRIQPSRPTPPPRAWRWARHHEVNSARNPKP